jgi:hypothetical protein
MRDYTHKNVYIGIDVHKKTYDRSSVIKAIMAL